MAVCCRYLVFWPAPQIPPTIERVYSPRAVVLVLREALHLLANPVLHCAYWLVLAYVPHAGFQACFFSAFATTPMCFSQRTLEVAVASYLEAHVSEVVLPASLSTRNVTGATPPGAGGAPRLSLEEFLDVVASPGRMDDMKHAEVSG